MKIIQMVVVSIGENIYFFAFINHMNKKAKLYRKNVYLCSIVFRLYFHFYFHFFSNLKTSEITVSCRTTPATRTQHTRNALTRVTKSSKILEWLTYKCPKFSEVSWNQGSDSIGFLSYKAMSIIVIIGFSFINN